MALRNRVTPFGEIVAIPERGTMMGNRGVLHNPQRTIVRDWQVRRWIACRLEFRGRHRQVMQPDRYTELFFLDEASALADGHRPCAECRIDDYRAFQSIWRDVHSTQDASADSMDRVLQSERRSGPFAKRTFRASLASLPNGTYVEVDSRAWLVLDDALLAWSGDRYVDHVRRPGDRQVAVLTPLSIVEALRRGYKPGLHPTAYSTFA